jgi:hypothetical protein
MRSQGKIDREWKKLPDERNEQRRVNFHFGKARIKMSGRGDPC